MITSIIIVMSSSSRRRRRLISNFSINRLLLILSSTLITLLLFHLPPTVADIGNAARYSPPYLPTACYGSDSSQFPSNNLFAAAGEGIWDNGAACGRQYLVRCISAANPSTCNRGRTIQVRIVDRAMSAASPPSRGGATLVLSTTAFGAITNNPADFINIDFQQV